MVDDVRLRFGVLDPKEGDPPTPTELNNELERRQTRLATPDSRPERIYNDLPGAYFVEIGTKVERDYKDFGNQGLEEHTNTEVYPTRVLYFENGGFVFEPRDYVPDERVPAFLLGRSPEAAEDDYEFFQDFQQETIRSEYDNAGEVSRIKFGSLGNVEGEDSGLSRLIEELGDEVGNLKLSRGRASTRNLKRSGMVDKFVGVSTIRQMTYYDRDGQRFVITDSGRLIFSAPEDDAEAEAEEIREKAEPFLHRLMNEDVGAGSGQSAMSQWTASDS